MKFSKILPLSLLATLALSGCSLGGKSTGFKNLEADKILDQAEQAVLMAKVEQASYAMSNVDIKMSTKNQDALSSTETVVTGTRTLYKGGSIITKSNSKQIRVSDGLTVQSEINSASYAGRLDEKRFFTTTESTGTSQYYIENIVEVKDDFELARSEISSLISLVFDSITNAARRKDGSFFLYKTSVYDEYLPYEFGNNETIEEHRIQKSQAVAELNTDYSIKSFEMMSSIETNVDPSTHEVSKQTKLINDILITYTASYNALTEAGEEISSRASMINNKPALAGTALMITGYTYDKDSKALTEVGSMDFGGSFIRYSHDRYHYTLAAEVPTSGYNAFSLELDYSIFTAKLEPGTIEKLLLPTGGVANDLNGLELVDKAKGAFYNKAEKSSLRFYVDFDISLVDGVAQISNLTYIVL